MVGPAGPRGHRAQGLDGQEVDPALILVPRAGDKTVSEKPLRRLIVTIKISNI